MRFVKMQGTGNDYVYVDCFHQRVDSPRELAPVIAHRRYGVGGDGLILIKPCATADAEMDMYNADGSRGEMCGNGLRCVAKYVHDHYVRDRRELTILTGRGPLVAIVHPGPGGTADRVSVDMGAPIFNGRDIPIDIDKPRVLHEELQAGDRRFKFSSVGMGNPHCVIFVDDVESFPVERYGPLIERHPLFPARVNVEFVQSTGERELIGRTWERGSGETWACGTGAAAASVVAVELGRARSPVVVRLKGGDLDLEWTPGEPVRMTGPAVEVFEGEWPDS